MSQKVPIASPYISTLNQHSIIINHFLSEAGQEMSEMLNKKDLVVADLGFTYRQINSWDEHGLLDIKRDGAQWRTFSFMDKVWLCLIREMRKYGISLKQIGRVKEFLTGISVSKAHMIPVLELFTAHAAPKKYPCVAIIFEDASALICQYDQWLAFQMADKVPNHVLIHLNPIFAEVFPKRKIMPNYKDVTAISADDLNMLSIIKDDDFEKVEIIYENGKADILRGMKRVDKKSRIHDLLNSANYQTIEIQKIAGNVERVVQWKKIKLNKS